MATFRGIVVDACPRSGLLETLWFAKMMGKEMEANLLVAAYAWPRLSIKEVLLPNFLLQARQAVMEDALASSRRAFEKVFSTGSGQADWCSGICEPVSAMRSHLFAADLLITDASESDECASPDIADIALEAGIPVLRLARQQPNTLFSTVLIGWKDVPQARRAVREALPILQSAESVTIVGVGDEVSEERLVAVAAHLVRHKVRARHRHIPATTQDVAWALLGQAQREDASLIVTGLYSRAPVTERIFGGVSTSLLNNANISWFMTH